MKREITKYISECDTCQRVKVSHLKVVGTLQPLPVPSWKWEEICMDFIMGLKGKCALGPFLSILVIKCKHRCQNVKICPWMKKVQITSKGMFLSLSTLVLCTNILSKC
jgi:hypothetical protein